MFKFFKKETEDKEPQKKEESEYISLDSPEIAGSITYYFKHDDDNTYLDLHLSDFEDKTIDKFSEIIAGISSLRMQLETVNMIKDVFLEMEEGDTFNKIVAKMIKHNEKDTAMLEKINKESDSREEQPWIKPSDIMK
tara:strand:+ start:70 stop:480 length:411 start_codon:yes stop_codon:yes gene_type:complete